MKAGVFTSRAMMKNLVCLLVLGLMVLNIVRLRTGSRREETQLVEGKEGSVAVMKEQERGLDSRGCDEEDRGVEVTEQVGEREQPALSELLDGYDERRELVGRVCHEQREDLEARWEDGGGEVAPIKLYRRYKARWPDRAWEGVLASADVLEKRDRGFLWCKVGHKAGIVVLVCQVPKAASESWTSLFIQQWYSRKKNQLMWKQQVQPMSIAQCSSAQ